MNISDAFPRDTRIARPPICQPRTTSILTQGETANRVLVAKIRVIHRESREPYGSPSIWDASVFVRIRCCRRSSRASKRNGLISCSTRARVLVALLEGPPSPRQISYYKNRTDDVLSTAFSKKLTAERACCTMISTSLSQ